MVFAHLPQKIVYLRHPQCLHNIDPQGAIEQGIENKYSPLTLVGEAQRDITAAYLREQFAPFDAVFSSTFTRTHTIPEAAGFQATPHSLLDERSMGIWHRLPKKEVEVLHPEIVGRLKKIGYYHFQPLEGESCIHVEARLCQFLQDESHFKGFKTMLISGHGTAGLCFRKVLLDGTVKDWHSWDRLRNASVTVYEKIDGEFVCTLYNHVPWEGLVEAEQGTEA